MYLLPKLLCNILRDAAWTGLFHRGNNAEKDTTRLKLSLSASCTMNLLSRHRMLGFLEMNQKELFKRVECIFGLKKNKRFRSVMSHIRPTTASEKKG